MARRLVQKGRRPQRPRSQAAPRSAAPLPWTGRRVAPEASGPPAAGGPGTLRPPLAPFPVPRRPQAGFRGQRPAPPTCHRLRDTRPPGPSPALAQGGSTHALGKQSVVQPSRREAIRLPTSPAGCQRDILPEPSSTLRLQTQSAWGCSPSVAQGDRRPCHTQLREMESHSNDAPTQDRKLQHEKSLAPVPSGAQGAACAEVRALLPGPRLGGARPAWPRDAAPVPCGGAGASALQGGVLTATWPLPGSSQGREEDVSTPGACVHLAARGVRWPGRTAGPEGAGTAKPQRVGPKWPRPDASCGQAPGRSRERRRVLPDLCPWSSGRWGARPKPP